MRIRQLDVSGFRNLTDQQINFSSNVAVLTANNGQGKTNLLEAIFFLSHGKSFRSAKIRDLTNWGKKESYIGGIFDTISGPKELRCEISEGKKRVFLNSKKIEKASNFYGQTTSIVFTPDELQIVKGSPSVRRQFLDRLISMLDQSYVESLVHYQRAVKSRNIVLTRFKDNSNALHVEISPWEKILAHYGKIITEKRREVISALSPAVSKFYNFLSTDSQSGKAAEEVTCSLNSNYPLDDLIEEQAREIYKKNRIKDIRIQSTSFGPHHDDLLLKMIFSNGARKAQQSSSQGQARCIALALKLAAVELIYLLKSESPILLLDDVESELDPSRKAAFFSVVKNLGSQVIITSTELSSSLSILESELEIFSMCCGCLKKVFI